MDIRDMIVTGAASVHRTLPAETIDAIVLKIAGKDAKNKQKYAWMAGRNMAITLNRREKYQAKLALLELQKQEEAKRQAELAKERAHEIRTALNAFVAALPSMRDQKRRNSSSMAQMGLDVLRAVLENDAEEFMKIRAQCSNENYFYQVRRRGLLLAKQFVDEATFRTLESLKGIAF